MAAVVSYDPRHCPACGGRGVVRARPVDGVESCMRAAAVLTVVGRSRDAAEAADLLAMLGLDPREAGVRVSCPAHVDARPLAALVSAVCPPPEAGAA